MYLAFHVEFLSSGYARLTVAYRYYHAGTDKLVRAKELSSPASVILYLAKSN
jgi:hypothetical protein